MCKDFATPPESISATVALQRMRALCVQLGKQRVEGQAIEPYHTSPPTSMHDVGWACAGGKRAQGRSGTWLEGGPRQWRTIAGVSVGGFATDAATGGRRPYGWGPATSTQIRGGSPTSSPAGRTRTRARVLGCHPSGTERPAPTAAGRGPGLPRIESGAGSGSGGGLAQIAKDAMDRRAVGSRPAAPRLHTPRSRRPGAGD